MVSQYSDFQKLKHTKQIARDHGYFVVEKPLYNKGDGHRIGTEYLLYREHSPRNMYVGKRRDVGALALLVKKVTNTT